MTEALPAHVGDGYDIFSPEYRADPAPTWKSVRESGCPVARHTGRHGEHRQPRRVGPVELAELAPLRRRPPRQRAHPHVDFADCSVPTTSRRRHVPRCPPEVGVDVISTFRPTDGAVTKSTAPPSPIHRTRRIARATAVSPLIVAHRPGPVAPVFPSTQVWPVPPCGVPSPPIVAPPPHGLHTPCRIPVPADEAGSLYLDGAHAARLTEGAS